MTANLTTGCRWEPDFPHHAELKIEEMPYRPPNSDLEGAPGQQLWELTAIDSPKHFIRYQVMFKQTCAWSTETVDTKGIIVELYDDED